jgi:peptidoglycan hydrolase-like protein with peptidoglycan-binding domain
MKKIILAVIFGLTLIPSIGFASIDNNLRYGSRGAQVTELQEFLIDKGFLQTQSTGNFYSLTLKAVKAFQSANNIPNTGYVGILTRTEINSQLVADTSGSTAQQLTETGTSTTATPPSPVITQLQQQNNLLQQQLTQLQTQTQNQAQQTQAIQNSLNQVVQNTTPVTPPVTPPTPLPAVYDPSCVAAPSIGINLSTTTLTVQPYDQNGGYDFQVLTKVTITSSCVFNPDSFIGVDTNQGPASIDDLTTLNGGTGMFGKILEINKYHNFKSTISADGKTIKFEGNVNVRALAPRTTYIIVSVDHKYANEATVNILAVPTANTNSPASA